MSKVEKAMQEGKIKQLIFRCDVRTEKEGWKQLESTAELKLRSKPRWVPEQLWFWCLNRLFILEAKIDTDGKYIDPERITIQEAA